MKVYKNEETAIIAAKKQALRSLKLEWSATHESQWLIINTTSICQCGNTPAVLAIFIEDKEEFYGLAGICQTCGK